MTGETNSHDRIAEELGAGRRALAVERGRAPQAAPSRIVVGWAREAGPSA